jgi:hypothetical protein
MQTGGLTTGLTAESELDLYREFSTHHLPKLTNYVVAVVSDGNNGPDAGSGTLVNVGGRHFVATAAHCIGRNTRVLASTRPLSPGLSAEVRALTVIRTGKMESETPDVGYLEIEDPKRPEVQWDQLSDERIVEGLIHIVGLPRVLDQIDKARREFSFGLGVFGSTLLEETDDYLKFAFPEKGTRYNPDTHQWEDSLFPPHPRGFSGGGCFGVSRREGSVNGRSLPVARNSVQLV